MVTPEPVSPEFLALQSALAGRYSLIRELGRGGMGVVFLAREVALDRLVAIKLLPPALAREDRYRERFLREARTAAGLAHPNIVPIHAVEADGDMVWFAMEYVAGESLGERVRQRGPLATADALRVLQQVAWALAHAHARGVIHRDVKPDNVLLEEGSDRVLVTDFGIAGRSDSATSSPGFGTPHYQSPEQADGRPPDARADVYALGVTAWVALTGRRPFEGATGAVLLVTQADSDTPSLGTVLGRPGAGVVELVDRAVARDPDARWATMEEMAHALDSLRARQPQLPMPLQRFARHTVEHGRQLGPVLGLTAAAAFGAVFIDAFLQSFLGFEEVMYLIVGVVGGAVSLALMVEHVREVRALARQGYGRPAALRVVGQVEADEAQFAEPPAGPAWTRRPQALISLGMALTIGGLYTVTHANATLPVLTGLVVSLFAPALVVGRVARLKGRTGSWWARVLRSRVGGWFWKAATLGLGRVPDAPIGGEPTALAVGGLIQDLWAALPAAEQQLLAEVPDLAQRLEARAMQPDDAHRTEALVALETLRMDLLRLRAGQLAADGLTDDLRKLRDVGLYVDAKDEVER